MKRIRILPSKRARIEIIPLIDVIFFLLATFVLVSLSMTKQPGIRLRLPESATSQPHELKESVTISINDQGAVFWEKEMVPFGRFLTQIVTYRETCREEGSEPIVLLNADVGAHYGHVVAIMDEIRKAGIEKITIETRVKPSKPAPTP